MSTSLPLLHFNIPLLTPPLSPSSPFPSPHVLTMPRFSSILLVVGAVLSLVASPVFSLSPSSLFTTPSNSRNIKPSFLRPPSTSTTLQPIDLTATPAFNTSSWFGAAYTPSPAGNQLWWYEYSRYEPIVKRELSAVARIYGFTALRTFIHNMVYDAAPTQFLDNIERYLTLCHSLGIKPGFVFFDDWSAHNTTITISHIAHPPQQTPLCLPLTLHCPCL